MDKNCRTCTHFYWKKLRRTCKINHKDIGLPNHKEWLKMADCEKWDDRTEKVIKCIK